MRLQQLTRSSIRGLKVIQKCLYIPMDGKTEASYYCFMRNLVCSEVMMNAKAYPQCTIRAVHKRAILYHSIKNQLLVVVIIA